VLEGSGGNIAVLTGPDGKVLIDAGIGVARPQLKKALTGLGTDAITHLINTHWHFDHADGNEWLHSVGAKIIAQAPCRISGFWSDAALEAPAIVAGLDDVAVVAEPVEERIGHLGVAEDGRPFAWRAILEVRAFAFETPLAIPEPHVAAENGEY
jgi:glyoxylase-like metal-dependent hydrolase (beta-lactamase superfamily II)